MTMVKAIKRWMNRILAFSSAAMLAAMTVIAFYQVVTRYVFNSPSSWSEELLTYTFSWTSMLAATLVFGERDHMKLSFFSDKVKGRNGVILAIATEAVICVFSVLVLIFGGIAIVNLTMTQVTASLGIPMGIVYCIMPVSGVLISIYCILNIAELSGRLRKGEER